MKSKLFFTLLITLLLSGCDQKNAVIRDELRLIEKTSKDANQFDFVRESAGRFADILSEKPGIRQRQVFRAHWQMNSCRNEATIAAYVAFLKALEKKVPEILPSVEVYESMNNKAGASDIIEYTLGQTAIMMSNSIRNITLYNDPAADAEVEGVLRSLREKHGTTETGKKILEFLNMVHGQALTDRSGSSKPWESPSRARPGDVGETTFERVD
jgi:hypothetical protein